MDILLVAYRFPPQTGGGIHRPHKFAKYLGRAGVNVTVVTIAPDTEEPDARPADLPDNVRIVRVAERGWMPALRRMRTTGRSSLPSLLRLRSIVLAKWILVETFVPDEHAEFVGAVASIANIPEFRDVDAVISTGGPWSGFVAGDELARRLRVPHVMDYRDPWTARPPAWPALPGYRARRLNRKLERGLCRRAAFIISAHAAVAGMLEEQLELPGLAARVHWIPNGYDPEDFVGIEPRTSDRFSLTWAGSLYRGRSLEPIVRCLEDLGEAGEIDLERVELRVLGVHPERVRSQVQDARLLKNMIAPGEVTHDDALAFILGSTVNLLVDISYDGPIVHTPGKLYEYLASGRPVLSISTAGVTADLIREAQAGWVVAPNDSAALRDALRSAYGIWASGGAMPRAIPAVTEAYDRGKSTLRLKKLLEEMLRETPAPRAKPQR